ncbi:MAG TPA: DNA polymerase IV [Mycobacteriales bacterium]|nr:DNA polymerase IV [Mycobacteriales bacterium]
MGRSGELPRAGAVGPVGDDTGCPILHVDMDAFFAHVEARRRPELAGRPVIVGGTGPRGVVSSASYPARQCGVRSAMPMSRARQLCPQAVVLPPDLIHYAEVSRGVMEIFRSCTPLVEPRSLDEAFLDVSGAVRLLGPPARIGALIRARVADQEGITCSVGVASTKFVAKLASARCKPDGLLVVPVDGVIEFLHPLPIAALWGVGQQTAAQLHQVGLRTVADVARTPRTSLQRMVGQAVGAHLHELAWGRDEGRVVPASRERSIGADETFDVDIGDPAAIHRELLRLAERTASRVRAAGQVGRTVSIKIRFTDFATITRARTLAAPTDVGQDIYAAARQLFDALDLGHTPIRLVGVRVEGLVRAGLAPPQPELGARARGWPEADRAVDQAVTRFGPGVVRPAALVRPPAGDAKSRPRAALAGPVALPNARRSDGGSALPSA